MPSEALARILNGQTIDAGSFGECTPKTSPCALVVEGQMRRCLQSSGAMLCATYFRRVSKVCYESSRCIFIKARLHTRQSFGTYLCPQDAVALSHCECAVAIGAFDGVHRGHRHLIHQMVADARERGIAAIAVTFDPDPDTVVSATPAPKLTLVADRLRLLASSGVDAVCVVPFDSALASMDHDAFFTRVLLPVLDIRSVHVGSNFRRTSWSF